MSLPPSDIAKPVWCLLVPSCDNYNDTWPLFFHFLFKYWPDVPQPVYLVSNTTTFADERVQTILVGPDRQWAANVHQALDQITAEFLFILLDDYLLNATVDSARVEEAWRQFHRLNGVYLSADSFKKAGERIPDTWFCQVKRDQLYVGLNADFFGKAYLRKVTDAPGLNIWQTENRLKLLARENSQGHFFIEPGTPAPVTYVESIKGYFWKPMAIEFLARHNVTPDLKRRPCPPQGRDPFSRLWRSVLKRRIWYASRLNQRLGGRLRPKVIQPLNVQPGKG